MKKVLFAITMVFSCFFISCNDKAGGISAAAQKNLDAMHGINKCIATKDFTKLGDFIAEDGIDHAGETGDIKGLSNMKAELTKMVAAYDSSTTTIIKEMADDEYVMTWQRYAGVLKTDQMGMKAGEKYNMTALEVSKFKDGKAIEHWTFLESAEMMKMIASMPPPPPSAATSASKDSINGVAPKKVR